MPSMPGSGTAVPPEVLVVPPEVLVVPPEVVVVPPEVLVELVDEVEDEELVVVPEWPQPG